MREAADHPTSARLISGLRSQLVRFQYRTILVPGRSEHSYSEHEAIVEAIARHDPDAAEAAMRAHLSHVAAALHAATQDAAGVGHANGSASASASARPSAPASRPLAAPYAELAELGSATVYEAGGRRGYVDADLHPDRPRLARRRARRGRCAADRTTT